MLRLTCLVLLLAPVTAFAHAGEDHGAGWSLDMWIAVSLVLLLFIYLVGCRRLMQRTGRVPAGRTYFLAGWAVLALSLLSPLHEAGERSFTMHMIEHELIMLVATALLAGSSSGGVLAWGLPKSARQQLRGSWTVPLGRLWKRLTEPVTATVVQSAALWAWHAPALFDAALDHRAVHIAQHASFGVTSLLFWWAMLHPRGRGHGYGVSAACLFITSLVGGALGALMAFSSSPWYAGYAAMGLTGIGPDPAADQQLAGLLMWIPGGLVHAGAAVAMLYRWLKVAEGNHALAVR